MEPRSQTGAGAVGRLAAIDFFDLMEQQ